MVIRGRALPLPLYRKRRSAAMRLLAKHSGDPVPLLVVGIPFEDPSAMTTPLAGKARQDPWFDWFSGCHEPDAALLIDPTGPKRDTLLLEAGDPKRVIWDGARLPPGTEAKRAFGVHATAPIGELKQRVADAAERAGGRIALLWRTSEPGFQSAQAQVWKRRLRGVTAIDAEPVLVPLRMIKAPEEIACHQRAVDVTNVGLRAMLKQLPKMRNESEIAGVLAQHYLGAEHEPLAFPTIAGGGANAATLHYPHNDQPLPKKGCVLVDSGARSGGYCADVTRTVPRHGRFDDARFKECYELVLRCNELGRKHARPGITLRELNEIAWQPIIDAGFTRHHGLSHHIGLDVHDPSDREAPLAPGMLISNEPGIYLPDEAIGIRIEDDLVITEDGCTVTTKAIPKTVKAIERAMNG